MILRFTTSACSLRRQIQTQPLRTSSFTLSHDRSVGGGLLLTHSAQTANPLASADFQSARQMHGVTLKAKKKGVRAVVSYVDESRRIEIQRASAFSTAEARFALRPFAADDVAHVALATRGEAFFFRSGVFVTWGAADFEIEALLRIATKVGENKYGDLEGGIINDTIVIGNDLPPDHAKLASLENLLDSHLDKTRDIPNLLQKGKRLPIGRHAILKSLGELFALRGNVNLHSELLDLPDFCWSSSKMEDAFSDISRNLDVRARIAIFNKKLDYANELSESTALKLEWIIIWLITIAVGFETVNYMDHLARKEKIRARKLLQREIDLLELEASASA
ncbi:hypothetical protein BDR26DRAFT_855876 [Obelidium mucronatum]|nr:hypothetical protein BDR26DRAFT_855876 [Obelidium mucronatum]